MQKIYYVIIKGRTLESRDLKELLARAVSEKRNLDRKSQFQNRSHRQAPVENSLSPCGAVDQAAMF
jgi:hypothetical protein